MQPSFLDGWPQSRKYSFNMGICIYIYTSSNSRCNIWAVKSRAGVGWVEMRGGRDYLPCLRTTQHTLNISNQSFLLIHVYPTPSLSASLTHDVRNVGFICILFIHTNTFFKLANRKKKTTPSSTHQIVLLHNSKFRIHDFYACRLVYRCISSPILLSIINCVVRES